MTHSFIRFHRLLVELQVIAARLKMNAELEKINA